MRRILAHFGAAANPYLLWLVCVLLLAVMVVSIAHAHGPAQWIQDGHYRNAANELCCGERDCVELSSDDVKVTTAGYLVIFRDGNGAESGREVVPFSEAAISPTGTYWRCQWGGERKCFFAPPPST